MVMHPPTRAYVLLSPEALGRKLTAAANRIESLGGRPPCRAFRPHAGRRSGQMYSGLKRIDSTLGGSGVVLWDWNWLRARTADSTFERITKRVSGGDIIVMHDGDESAPRKPQPQTVEATARLIVVLAAPG